MLTTQNTRLSAASAPKAICRLLVGQNTRLLLPCSMLLGASFLMLVDDLARCFTTSEIPLGILTALVGAPLFLYLIVKGGARDAA